MHNPTSPSFSILRIVCHTVGHKYVKTRKITNHIHEYKCKNCGREVTENPAGKIELLTHKVKEVNNNVAAYFEKRSRRLTV
ncbi:hypothetical protein [Marixanthomonas spongiae]|uniref:Uncharacterized protein n=1 Tax=Marixanthomonas spongiae TaxID=2174845 RepID=A0A2U0HZ86_9FLAO|nr:hypothetical protein [Marixanthomonas spongiae]PVW14129.1 hypothetical protein DDV96_09950 [Marixanthomonas spongiae]